MTFHPLRLFVGRIWGMIREGVRAVQAINRKYHTPRIRMTPWVKTALLLLRLYLIVLVLILLYKFVVTVRGG